MPRSKFIVAVVLVVSFFLSTTAAYALDIRSLVAEYHKVYGNEQAEQAIVSKLATERQHALEYLEKEIYSIKKAIKFHGRNAPEIDRGHRFHMMQQEQYEEGLKELRQMEEEHKRLVALRGKLRANRSAKKPPRFDMGGEAHSETKGPTIKEMPATAVFVQGSGSGQQLWILMKSGQDSLIEGRSHGGRHSSAPKRIRALLTKSQIAAMKRVLAIKRAWTSVVIAGTLHLKQGGNQRYLVRRADDVRSARDGRGLTLDRSIGRPDVRPGRPHRWRR